MLPAEAHSRGRDSMPKPVFTAAGTTSSSRAKQVQPVASSAAAGKRAPAKPTSRQSATKMENSGPRDMDVKPNKTIKSTTKLANLEHHHNIDIIKSQPIIIKPQGSENTGKQFDFISTAPSNTAVSRNAQNSSTSTNHVQASSPLQPDEDGQASSQSSEMPGALPRLVPGEASQTKSDKVNGKSAFVTEPVHDQASLPAPVPTSDPLQVAAQLYPWLYMTSTLEACFRTSEDATTRDLQAKEKYSAKEEEDINDEQTRLEAERAIEFYDELSKDGDAFSQSAPHIMQTFLAHEEACTRAEAEALQLATAPLSMTSYDGEDWEAPLKAYTSMLDKLEVLHTEAMELESSIQKLTASHPVVTQVQGLSADDNITVGPLPSTVAPMARQQILDVFQTCLPVLRARMGNLLMAQELIDGAQENLSVSLRMESLGLAD